MNDAAAKGKGKRQDKKKAGVALKTIPEYDPKTNWVNGKFPPTVRAVISLSDDEDVVSDGTYDLDGSISAKKIRPSVFNDSDVEGPSTSAAAVSAPAVSAPAVSAPAANKRKIAPKIAPIIIRKGAIVKKGKIVRAVASISSPQ